MRLARMMIVRVHYAAAAVQAVMYPNKNLSKLVSIRNRVLESYSAFTIGIAEVQSETTSPKHFSGAVVDLSYLV